MRTAMRHGRLGVLGLVVGLGVGAALSRADGPATRPADRLAALRRARVDEVDQASKLAMELYSRGLGDYLWVLQADQQRVAARLDAAATAADRVAVLRDARAVATEHEDLTVSRFKAGLTSDLDVHSARAFRLGLDVQLAEAGQP